MWEGWLSTVQKGLMRESKVLKETRKHGGQVSGAGTPMGRHDKDKGQEAGAAWRGPRILPPGRQAQPRPGSRGPGASACSPPRPHALICKAFPGDTQLCSTRDPLAPPWMRLFLSPSTPEALTGGHLSPGFEPCQAHSWPGVCGCLGRLGRGRGAVASLEQGCWRPQLPGREVLSTSEARIQEGRPGRSPAQTRCRVRTRGEGVKLPKGYSGHSYLSGVLSSVQLNRPERRPGEGAGPRGPPPGHGALPGAGRRAPGTVEEGLSPPGSQGLGLTRAECIRPGSGPPLEQPTRHASAPTSSQEPPIPQGPSSPWPTGTIFLIQPIIPPIPTAWPWVRPHSFSFRPAVSFPIPD